MDNTASRTKQTSQQAKRFAIGMTLPTLAVLLVMTAYPLISTFLYSFTDYNYLKGADRAEFVLFKNYISLLENGYFRQAIWNTVRFTFLAVVLELGFGLVLAIFVNSLGRGKKIMRTLLLLPYLLPAVTDVYKRQSESRVGRVARTEDYLYAVYAPGVNGGEKGAADRYADDYLYDLKKDPWQLENVVADPAYAKAKADMRARLLDWIERAEGYRPEITD